MSEPTAAGVMILDPDGRVLMVRRARGDHAGTWALPGGRIEAGETPEAAALREVREEIGADVKLDVSMPAFTVGEFTTFLSAADGVSPILNEEHDAFEWSPMTNMPQPLHPNMPALIEMVRDAMRRTCDASPPRRAVHVHLYRR